MARIALSEAIGETPENDPTRKSERQAARQRIPLEQAVSQPAQPKRVPLGEATAAQPAPQAGPRRVSLEEAVAQPPPSGGGGVMDTAQRSYADAASGVGSGIEAAGEAMGFEGAQNLGRSMQQYWGDVSGEAEEAGGVSVPDTLKGGYADVASGLGSILDYAGKRFSNRGLSDTGESMKAYWDKVAKESPMSETAQVSPYDDPKVLANPNWWIENTARMAPSFALPAGAGGAGFKIASKALPGLPKIAAAFGAGVGGLFGGGLEGAQTYEEGMEMGQEEPTAARAGEAMALGSGILNAIPFYKILNPGARGVVRRFMAAGMSEGLTEAAEEPLDAVIQGLVYDKETDWEDVARSMLHVMPPAFLLGGVAGAGSPSAQAPETGAPTPETPPSAPQTPSARPGGELAPAPEQDETALTGQPGEPGTPVEDVSLVGESPEEALADRMAREFPEETLEPGGPAPDAPAPGSVQDESMDLSGPVVQPTADVVPMRPDEEITMEGPADPDLADFLERRQQAPQQPATAPEPAPGAQVPPQGQIAPVSEPGGRQETVRSANQRAKEAESVREREKDQLQDQLDRGEITRDEFAAKEDASRLKLLEAQIEQDEAYAVPGDKEAAARKQQRDRIRARAAGTAPQETPEYLKTPDRPDVKIPRQMIPAAELNTDAQTYQYKEGADTEGVTDRLKGVQKWDDMKSGRVVVHEREDGSRYIADGHQRLGLAKKLESEGHPPINLDAIVLREADGFSVEDAKIMGAAKNMAEGTGTAWDAARIFRDSDADTIAESLPPNSAIVRDGRRLAALSDEATQAAINADVDPVYAGIAAQRFSDPTEQMAAIKALVRYNPATQGQAHALMADLAEAGTQVDQSDLFGGTDDSVMQARMRLIDRVQSRVRKDRAIMNGLVRNQKTIEGAARNVVDQEGSQAAKEESEAIARFLQHISTNQELNSYVTEQAKKVAAGEVKAGEAAEQVLERARASLERTESKPAARQEEQQDLIGGQDDTALKVRQEREKAVAAQRSAPPMDEGEGDLFSDKSKQQDVEDVSKAGPEYTFETQTGHTAAVNSVEDAVAKWERLRDDERIEGGVRDIGSGGVVKKNGKPVARISYNGRVWDMDNNPLERDGTKPGSEGFLKEFEEAFGKSAESTQQAESDTRIGAAVDALEEYAKEQDAVAEDWASREYKENKRTVDLEHNELSNRGRASVGQLNEGRRQRRVKEARSNAKNARDVAAKIKSGELTVEGIYNEAKTKADFHRNEAVSKELPKSATKRNYLEYELNQELAGKPVIGPNTLGSRFIDIAQKPAADQLSQDRQAEPAPKAPATPQQDDVGLLGENDPSAVRGLEALRDDPDAVRLSGPLKGGRDKDGNQRPDWTPVGKGFSARAYVWDGKPIQEVKAPSGAVARRGLNSQGESKGKPYSELEATTSLQKMLSGVPFQEFTAYFDQAPAITKQEKTDKPQTVRLYRGTSHPMEDMSWFTPDREAAKEYSTLDEGGRIVARDVTLNNVAEPADVRRVADELGLDYKNESAYSMVTPDSYEGADQIIPELQKRGYDAVHMPKGEDFTPDGREIESYLVFNPPAEPARKTPTTPKKKAKKKAAKQPTESKREPAKKAGTKADRGTAMFSEDVAPETGQPVSFRYAHNPESATRLFGVPDKDAPYYRGYEPSGKYIGPAGPVDNQLPNLEYGTVSFSNPLVLKNKMGEWKKDLSDRYGGKAGKELSKAVIADGYDGIVTVEDGGYISESVDLSTFDESRAMYSKEDDRLVVLHNMSTEEFRKSSVLGGLPVPSVAVTQAGNEFNDFGDITLVGTKDMIDPSYAENEVYETDAYSPTFPRVRRKVNQAKLTDKIGELSKVPGSSQRGGQGPYIYSVEEVIERDESLQNLKIDSLGMHMNAAQEVLGLAFLQDRGNPVEIPMRFSEGRSRMLEDAEVRKELRAMPLPEKRLSPGSPEYNEYAAKATEVTRQHLMRQYGKIEDLKTDTQSFVEDIMGRDTDDNGVLLFSDVMQFYEDHKDVKNGNIKRPDSRKLTNRIKRGIRKEGVSEYNEWVDQKFDGVLGQPYIEKGRKKLPVTLENIVDVMTSGRTQARGEGMFFGLGEARAMAAKRFKNIKDMQDARDRIVPKSEQEAEAEKVKERFFAWQEDISGYYEYDNQFDALDDLSKTLGEFGKGAKTEGRLNSILRKNGYKNVPEVYLEDGVQLAKDMLAVPVEYFEAKPQRAVLFEEFAGAVVPRGTDKSTIQMLKDNGIKRIRYYKKFNAQDRIRAVRDFKDVMFNVESGEVGGMSVTDATNSLRQIVGKKGVHKLFRSGRFNILPDQRALEEVVGERAESGGRVKGMYSPAERKSYIVAGNVSPDQLQGVFLHEVGAHYGLPRMIGRKEYEKIKRQLQNLHRLGNKRVVEARNRVPKNTPQQYVWDETLAYLAENPANHNMSLLKSVWTKIKAFLKEIGVLHAIDLSDADIVQMVRGAAVHAAKTAPRRPIRTRPGVYDKVAKALAPKGTAQAYARQVRQMVSDGQITQAQADRITPWLNQHKRTPSPSERLDETVLDIPAKRSKTIRRDDVLEFLRGEGFLSQKERRDNAAMASKERGDRSDTPQPRERSMRTIEEAQAQMEAPIFRAGQDSAGEHWTFDPDVAAAYQHNQPFGGPNIYVAEGKGLNILDAREREGSFLNEHLGDDWNTQFETAAWAMESDEVKMVLRDEGYDGVRYQDDFPNGGDAVFIPTPPSGEQLAVSEQESLLRALDSLSPWGEGQDIRQDARKYVSRNFDIVDQNGDRIDPTDEREIDHGDIHSILEGEREIVDGGFVYTVTPKPGSFNQPAPDTGALFSKRRTSRDKLRDMGMDFENLPGDQEGSQTRATEPVDQEPDTVDSEAAREQLRKRGYEGGPMFSVDSDQQDRGTIAHMITGEEKVTFHPATQQQNKLKRYLKRYFTKEGLLTDEAFARHVESMGIKNEDELVTQFMVDGMVKAARRAYKKPWMKVSERDKAQMNEYLAGNNQADVPATVKRELDNMRTSLDAESGRVQEMLIDEIMYRLHALNPDQRAKAMELIRNRDQELTPESVEGVDPIVVRKLMMYRTIEGNKRQWLNRSYAVFDNDKWIDEVADDVKERARQYLMQQVEGSPSLSQMSDQAKADYVEGLMNKMLQPKARDLMSFMNSSQLGQKDLSVLKRRKDIAPEIRELMGEYKDPRVNYARSMGKMSYLVANHHFLRSVREDGLGVFLSARPSGRMSEEITSWDQNQMTPLAGLYAPPEFAAALREAAEPAAMQSWMRNYMRYFNVPVKYGKAQPLDAVVHTPTGPTCMGDLSVGDVVCGAGTKTAVTGVYPQGKLDVYKLTFCDGSTTRASGEHLWEVIIDSKSRVVTTQDLLELPKWRIEKRQVAIPVDKAEFESQTTLLDPYLLGVIIGDGCLTSNMVRLSNPDSEVIERVREALPEGYVMESPPSWADIDYAIKAENFSDAKRDGNAVRNALDELGLMGHKSLDKFIPESYKRNSEVVRMELMRGLLDTDGTVNRVGQPIFNTSSSQLAKDVQELAESLGASVLCNEKRTASGNTGYELNIRVHDARQWFHLSRKRDKASPRKKPLKRTIKSIEHDGQEECQCISVDDPRSLYMTDRFVLTHNTVFSPTTMARNFLSASMFTVMNGHFNYSHVLKAGSHTWADLGSSNPAKMDYLRRMVRLGVLHDNPRARELREALDEALDMNALEGSLPARGVKTILNTATKMYRAGDDFWKIIGFENTKADLMRTGMPEAEAEVMAADRVRNGYPTYSMVPGAIRGLRRFPVVGTFVSFPWEILRNTRHQFRFLREDWNAGRTSMVGKRAVGMGIAGSIAHGISMATMAYFGLDDEDDEAIRQMAPEWQQNAQLAYLPPNEDGQMRYLDLSHLDPYTYLKIPFNALANGNYESLDEAAIAGMQEFLEPFLGSEIGFKALGQVWFNSTEYGPVYDENAHWSIRGKQIVWDHLRKELQPGLFSNVERTIKAWKDIYTSYGKKYELSDELLAWGGLRISTMAPEISLRFRSFEFNDQKSGANRPTYRAFRDPNIGAYEDIPGAVEQSKAQWREAFKGMHASIRAARKIGMEDGEIVMALKEGGIAGKYIGPLMGGHVPPWRPYEPTLSNARASLLKTRDDPAEKKALMQDFQKRRELLHQSLSQ